MVELSGDEVKRFFENQFIIRAKDRKFDKKIIIIELIIVYVNINLVLLI